MKSIKFNINIPAVTKKNHSQIIMVKGRPMLIPSKQYRQYEKDCALYLKPLMIDYPVNIKCVYYMPTRRRVDLVNLLSASMDVLVKHGVIVDDNRNIAYSHDGSEVLYDKNNPRVEIEITERKEYEEWKVK